MSQGQNPLPDPGAGRLSVESLEHRLRALPPPQVPEALPARLIATIPAAKAAGGIATAVFHRWIWIAAAGTICIAGSFAAYSWLRSPSQVNNGSEKRGNESGTATTRQNVTESSQAIRDYERAVVVDPYNASAWFNLAKAQAAAHRPADATSSAEKALDIAHARNLAELAKTIEAWLQSHRPGDSGKQ
jgi:tetratricopeptide (TPR) repeat protein